MADSRHAILAIAALTLPAAAALAQRVPMPPEIATAVNSGDLPKAQRLADEALAGCEANKPRADECYILLVVQADLLIRQNRPEAAEAGTRRALEIAERVVGPDSADAMAVLGMLNAILNMRGRLADQEAVLRRIIAVSRARTGEASPQTLVTTIQLAGNLSLRSRHTEGEALLRPILARLRTNPDADRGLLAETLNALSGPVGAAGRLAEAEGYQREAYHLLQGMLGENHPSTLIVMIGLAGTLESQDKDEEARALVERVVALGQDQPAAAGIQIQALMFLARTETDGARAEAYGRRAIALVERTLGSDNPGMRITLLNLAFVLAQHRRHAPAEEIARRALASIEAQPPAAILPAEHALALATLANLLREQRKVPETERVYRRALAAVLPAFPADSAMMISTMLGLGAELLDSPATTAEGRSLLRRASQGLLRQLQSAVAFDARAQRELRKNAIIFRYQVRAAWQLAAR
jgi:tetratricopeptide (TPR) repeat protein